MPNSTRKMAAERRRSAWRVTILSLFGLALILVAALNLDYAGVGALGVLGLLIVARLWSDYNDRHVTHHLKREKDAIRGAIAEEEVQRLLDSLNDGYFTIHDVETPCGNIDHIVLSRAGGVFLIETKAHGGRVDRSGEDLILNGHSPDKDFIAQVHQNTFWLRDEIEAVAGSQPWVTALLVFTNAFVPRFPPIRGVRVLNKRFLLAALTSTSSRNQSVWQAREAIMRKLVYGTELPAPSDHRRREAA